MTVRTEPSKWLFGKVVYYLNQNMKEDAREEGKKQNQFRKHLGQSNRKKKNENQSSYSLKNEEL